jgi:cytosine/uracil/thiamine/allantoin permease
MQDNQKLINADLAPVSPEQRTWTQWNLAALWVGMSVCIPTYMLAAGLIKAGMSWWQALLTVSLANFIVLIPMILNGHAGTRYGIPLPVLMRSSFGTLGTNIPSLMRGLVACGWFGIQTWIGGSAIYALSDIAFGIRAIDSAPLPILQITALQFVCFMIFWAINIAIILKGIDSIKWLENWAAPFLITVGLALLAWGLSQGGGFSSIFSQDNVRKVRNYQFTLPDSIRSGLDQGVISDSLRRDILAKTKWPTATTLQITKVQKNGQIWLMTASVPLARPPSSSTTFAQNSREVYLFRIEQTRANTIAFYDWKEQQDFNFWLVFFPLLTAMIGFWSTLALNIPDFTRYARSQRDQILGQAIGLPTTMTLFSFIGIAVTAATVVVFGEAIWDPVDLLSRFQAPAVVAISLIGLTIATLTTNIAANVVAPANGFSNLAPHKISFKMGGLITGIIGIMIMPWRLTADLGGYIYTWLIGYSALLGAIAGVMLADYYLLRKTRLDIEALYSATGEYSFGGSGHNWRAHVALLLGIIPNIPGFLQAASNGAIQVPTFFNAIYTYAWFVSLIIAGVLYLILSKIFVPRKYLDLP